MGPQAVVHRLVKPLKPVMLFAEASLPVNQRPALTEGASGAFPFPDQDKTRVEVVDVPYCHRLVSMALAKRASLDHKTVWKMDIQY
jgi:hypothetical protein